MDVASEVAAWTERAAVARAAGAELELLSDQLRQTVMRNYFGIGCLEGTALYEQLRQMLNNSSDTLRAHAATAIHLSESATRAGHDLTATDRESAGKLAGG